MTRVGVAVGDAPQGAGGAANRCSTLHDIRGRLGVRMGGTRRLAPPTRSTLPPAAYRQCTVGTRRLHPGPWRA
ncbi:hypothetical protein QJS66_10450 [Kocuria rhizophila]|nr:hypothetical protein QJS66_10450 [Kocuria rhizophila]